MNGELYLNGGGGEVFRNFFYLLGGGYTIKQFLWTFYSRFDPRTCTGRFSEARYLDALAKKIQGVVGRENTRLERQDIEFLFPGFRCRFWMGRNTSLDNRFGWALTPFADHAIVWDALAIPLRYKTFGAFEAKLINRVSARIASYPSAYGRDFSGRPSLGHIVKESATLLRPPILRKYAYRLKAGRRIAFPYFLTKDYLSEAIDPSFPILSQFVHVEKINDVDQYNRLCTLAYLFERYPYESEPAKY